MIIHLTQIAKRAPFVQCKVDIQLEWFKFAMQTYVGKWNPRVIPCVDKLQLTKFAEHQEFAMQNISNWPFWPTIE